MSDTTSENLGQDGQGITRRDLLRRGAVLGGAVVWTTPVVQTLGMGRAFAQTASPTGGKAISYIGINVDCGDDKFFVKWEDGGGWEDSPGNAPECADKDDLYPGANGSGKGFSISDGPTSGCKNLTIPEAYANCTITVWVKAGSDQSTGGSACNTYPNVQPGTITVCSAAI